MMCQVIYSFVYLSLITLVITLPISNNNQWNQLDVSEKCNDSSSWTWPEMQFVSTGSSIWNQLPDIIKKSEEICQLKDQLDVCIDELYTIIQYNYVIENDSLWLTTSDCVDEVNGTVHFNECYEPVLIWYRKRFSPAIHIEMKNVTINAYKRNNHALEHQFYLLIGQDGFESELPRLILDFNGDQIRVYEEGILTKIDKLKPLSITKEVVTVNISVTLFFSKVLIKMRSEKLYPLVKKVMEYNISNKLWLYPLDWAHLRVGFRAHGLNDVQWNKSNYIIRSATFNDINDIKNYSSK